MKNKGLMICLIVLAVGVLFSGVGLAMGGVVYGISFGRNGLVVHSNVSPATDADGQKVLHESKEVDAFENLNMNISYADIVIVESDHYGVEYQTQNSLPVTIQSEGNTLKVTQGKGFQGLTFFSIGTAGRWGQKADYVTVYVPKDTKLDSVIIEEDSGDIDISDIQAEKVTLDNDYGDVKATNLAGKEVYFDMESGDLTIKNAEGDSCKIYSSYGSVSIDESNFQNELVYDMDSGDMRLDTVTAKLIHGDSSYGDFDAKSLTIEEAKLAASSGDMDFKDLSCKKTTIKSAYGSVKIELREEVSGYNTDLETDYGDIEVDGSKEGDKYKRADSNLQNELIIRCDSGDIKVTGAK